MAIDTPPSGSGKPRRSRRQALLYDQAGVRELAVDDHRFVVAASRGFPDATFRLQLFIGDGLRPIAVVTQVVPLEGAGTVNNAERYAEAIWAELLPAEPLPPILIGHMLAGGMGYGYEELNDLGWMPVDFHVADALQHELVRSPIWGGKMSTAELEYLVGCHVDPARGEFVIPAEAR